MGLYSNIETDSILKNNTTLTLNKFKKSGLGKLFSLERALYSINSLKCKELVEVTFPTFSKAKTRRPIRRWR